MKLYAPSALTNFLFSQSSFYKISSGYCRGPEGGAGIVLIDSVVSIYRHFLASTKRQTRAITKAALRSAREIYICISDTTKEVNIFGHGKLATRKNAITAVYFNSTVRLGCREKLYFCSDVVHKVKAGAQS